MAIRPITSFRCLCTVLCTMTLKWIQSNPKYVLTKHLVQRYGSLYRLSLLICFFQNISQRWCSAPLPIGARCGNWRVWNKQCGASAPVCGQLYSLTNMISERTGPSGLYTNPPRNLWGPPSLTVAIAALLKCYLPLVQMCREVFTGSELVP